MRNPDPAIQKFNLYFRFALFRYLYQNVSEDDKRIGIHMVADAKAQAKQQNTNMVNFQHND